MRHVEAEERGLERAGVCQDLPEQPQEKDQIPLLLKPVGVSLVHTFPAGGVPLTDDLGHGTGQRRQNDSQVPKDLWDVAVGEHCGQESHDLLVLRGRILVSKEQGVAFEIRGAVPLVELVQGLFEEREAIRVRNQEVRMPSCCPGAQ